MYNNYTLSERPLTGLAASVEEIARSTVDRFTTSRTVESNGTCADASKASKSSKGHTFKIYIYVKQIDTHFDF